MNNKDIYAGHDNLAEMIKGHIGNWRDALNHQKIDQHDTSYLDHELSALDQIEKAASEVAQPSYVQQAIRTESRPESLKVNQFVLVDLMRMIVALGSAADLVKKNIFYGKPIEVGLYHDFLTNLSATVEKQLEMIDQVDDETISRMYDIGELAGITSDVTKRLTGLTEHIPVRLLHCALGIHTEAGEMFENLLEAYECGEVDELNFAEELGDVDWYKAIGHDATGVSEETLREANIAKLRKRYPEKFTDESALNRDLSGERGVLNEHLALTQGVAVYDKPVEYKAGDTVKLPDGVGGTIIS